MDTLLSRTLAKLMMKLIEATPERYRPLLVATLLILSMIMGILAILWMTAMFVPPWAILGAVGMATIYYFDFLPGQQYWNPSVRSLYPHRQFVLERWMMNGLRASGLFRSRRLKPKAQIPPEIWKLVLEHAIHHRGCLFDTTCEPKRFHLFANTRKHLYLDLDYSLDEIERKQLRLVCRTWRDLIDGCSNHRWVSNTWMPRRSSRITGLQRVDISIFGDTYMSRWCTEATLETLLDIPGATSQLAILGIQECRDESDPILSEQVFFERAQDLSAVRSIAYNCPEPERWTGFLANVERSFRSITSLCIEGKRVYEGEYVYGTLSLPFLEVLVLDAGWVEVTNWSLPSLQHISLGSDYLKRSGYDPSRLPGSVTKLRSLLLASDHPPMYLTSLFWADHGSLEFLGISASSTFILESPTTTHPLAHLCFHESEKSQIEDMDFYKTAYTITRIPNLKSINMPPLPIGQRTYPPPWMGLYEDLATRGVTWYDWKSETIRCVVKKKTQAEPSWWRTALDWISSAVNAVWFLHTSSVSIWGSSPLTPIVSQLSFIFFITQMYRLKALQI